jgi:Lon protease-like protein
MHSETVIPIFPLGLVMLPEMSLPLHIFEEYLQAEIEFFNDTPEEGTEVETLHKLADRGYQLLRQINTTTEQYNEDRFTNQPDYKTVSFIIAACEGFSFEEKQRFLEMTSTAKRLSSALEALEKLVERIRITRKIASIIGGNGNLPKPL